MSTPTARTLAYLRENGWQVEVVERFIPRVNVRRDLFGIGDLVAVKPGEPIALVQATSGANHAARLSKIEDEPRRLPWLAAGGQILIVSWSKRGPRGKRKIWEPRIEKWSEPCA